MKNVFGFGEFLILKEGQESVSSPMDWDPKKAAESIKKSAAQTGGSTKDKDPSGLSFKNIQGVFGSTDYTTRYVIAQALKLVGRDLFPTNSYNKDPEENKNREASNKDKPYYFNTYYIGEKKQNEMLDKISQPVLSAVKPLVSMILKSSKTTGQDKYFTSSAPSLPEVVKAKVEVDKVK